MNEFGLVHTGVSGTVSISREGVKKLLLGDERLLYSRVMTRWPEGETLLTEIVERTTERLWFGLVKRETHTRVTVAHRADGGLHVETWQLRRVYFRGKLWTSREAMNTVRQPAAKPRPEIIVEFVDEDPLRPILTFPADRVRWN